VAFEFVEYDAELRHHFESIFSDDFMRENTNFENFKSFQYSSAVFVNWNEDILIYNAQNLDDFVKGSTRFADWDERIRAGVDQKFNATKG
jgi:hypothetical protein